MPNVNSSQGVYWILTVPQHLFMPFLPRGCAYVRGQLERGGNTGYLHWQLLVVLEKKARLGAIKKLFGNEIHAELTKSKSADDYVWKEETRVEGTQFEIGKKPLKRNSKVDWEEVWKKAKVGELEEIPASIRVSSYAQIKRIEKDFMQPKPTTRRVRVYCGTTGVGKSRKAWDEAGWEAYPKDPCTKFWDGYQGQKKVVIDEFRGAIGISHLLRWFDRYPVCIESKGSGSVLCAEEIWVTSNLHPRDWYPNLDGATLDALLRRLEISEFNEPINFDDS